MLYCLLVHLFLEFFDLIIIDVLIVIHQLVNGALWCQFDDAVCHGLDKLVVMTRKEDVAFERHQIVVKCLNTLQIQMVRGGV